MKATLSLPLLVAFGAAVPAQSVSAGLTVTTPVTLSAQAAGLVAQQVLPAGALPPMGGSIAWPWSPTADSSSFLSWQSVATSRRVVISIDWLGTATAPAPSFADSGMVDIVVTLTTTSPAPVFVSLHQTVQAGPGATITTNAMDVGNDGSFEVDGLTTAATLGPITLSAPLPIRVRMQATQPGGGGSLLTNAIVVIPSNDLLISNVITSGCAGDQLRLEPSFFGRGIGLESEPAVPGDFAVAVLGLATQVISLPPAAAPCLLQPAVHLLVPLAAQQNSDFALPAAVRSVGFWAQAVVLSSFGSLTTTNSFFVIAY